MTDLVAQDLLDSLLASTEGMVREAREHPETATAAASAIARAWATGARMIELSSSAGQRRDEMD